jgi:hypothetical protein
MLGGILSLALALAPSAADGVAEALARGDEHYARRGEGARGGTALPFEVDGAIAEYRKALHLDPSSYEARLRLLRAFFFRGGFCGASPVEQREIFDEAKALAEETVRRLQADLGRRKGGGEAAGETPPAAQVYLWTAVSWGQWAVFHRISAAWHAAPARIRDLAQAVLAIDPALEQGAAHLILGRLHTEVPRVPFVTGWVSRERGLASLRAGLAVAPQNTALQYFLADALLALQPASVAEARALLQRCATAPPRPEYAVEDAHYAEQARQRLAGLR